MRINSSPEEYITAKIREEAMIPLTDRTCDLI